jgi:hypothetical protein
MTLFGSFSSNLAIFVKNRFFCLVFPTPLFKLPENCMVFGPAHILSFSVYPSITTEFGGFIAQN